jgi:hypothetical protein
VPKKIQRSNPRYYGFRRDCTRYYQSERRFYDCLEHFKSYEAAPKFKHRLEGTKKYTQVRIWEVVGEWHVGVCSRERLSPN